MIRRHVYESVIFFIHTLLQCLGTKLKVYSKQLYKKLSFASKIDYIFKKGPQNVECNLNWDAGQYRKYHAQLLLS